MNNKLTVETQVTADFVFGGLAKQPDIPLQRAEAQGFCLLPPNEVEVAEVREVGHVGEDST